MEMSDLSFSGKTILLVEDEYLVATMVMDALEDLGATIIGPVPSMQLAMDLLDNHQTRIDAATVDINLQGVNAYALADRLAAEGVPFVILTGYECLSLPERFHAAPCLSKPFAPEDVVDRLLAACRQTDAAKSVAGQTEPPEQPVSAR